MVALLGGCGDDDDTNDCGPAAAAETFNVTLNTTEEVPLCAGAGTGAAGAATVTVSADGCQVQVTNFTLTGLSSAVGMAHIHFGQPGVAGGIVLEFTDITSPINETFTSANYKTPSGAPTTYAAFITALRAGGAAYLNVHTADCGSGEVRGQID